MTVRLDDHRPMKRHAMLCAVGNVRVLPGSLTLIPGAKPERSEDDGSSGPLGVAAPGGPLVW